MQLPGHHLVLMFTWTASGQFQIKTDLELHSSKPTLSGKHKVHVLTYIKVKYYFQLYKTHY